MGAPDLIVLNHGHNELEGHLIDDADALLATLHRDYPSAVYLLTLQNPEAPGTPRAQKLDINVAQMKTYAAVHHYETVDVYDALRARPNWPKTMVDPNVSIHPSAAGYVIWAKLIEQAIQQAKPPGSRPAATSAPTTTQR